MNYGNADSVFHIKQKRNIFRQLECIFLGHNSETTQTAETHTSLRQRHANEAEVQETVSFDRA